MDNQHYNEVIEQLFARCPDLCGFAVQEKTAADAPAGEAEGELMVTAIGISPRINAEQYGEIFEQIATTLSELLDERPESCDYLRGRTFARAVH
ncbi:MAG TPA: hypothetical protein VHL85_08885 [Burkholderiales bacterium]|nr:hypothetical protein [Burkholderiales bacterium]